MIHLYYGDGKGKTTAACGLAVRAAGRGLSVLVAQFWKDGTSGEIGMLRRCGATVLEPDFRLDNGVTWREEYRSAAEIACVRMMDEVYRLHEAYGLILLDEITLVYGYGIIEDGRLTSFLEANRALREIVMTGRKYAPELEAYCDYVTDMKKIKHPYDRGILAREGIEY